MNNYTYIINECKKAFYGKWEEQAIKACVSRLSSLSHEELVLLLSCRWLTKQDEVRKEAVKVLFKEQIERHEQMIATSTIDELGAMLVEKGGNNVKWARIELKKRYQEVHHDDQMRITSKKEQLNKMLNGALCVRNGRSVDSPTRHLFLI